MRLMPKSLVLALAAFCLALPRPAAAQEFDPRQTLGTIISAFQYCSPAYNYVYQWFGPELYQAVFMQTNGSGCYPDIASAGPITDMQVIDRQDLPVGMMYVVRVTHARSQWAPGPPVDWFIGFNRFSGQVQYLNYQPSTAGGNLPTIETGPADNSRISPIVDNDGDDSQSQRGPGPVEERSERETAPQPRRDDRLERACQNYPNMCP